MKGNDVLKINKEIILQKIDKGLVGYDIEKSLLYTFNETAEFIFKKLKLGWVEEKIVVSLSKKYDIALPMLRKDVKSLIKEMLKNKIISSTRTK